MADALIDNPILNSPYEEPIRHWRFGEHGITDDVVEERRISSYFMPIARSKRSDQMEFQAEWTADRIEPNRFINDVRERVAMWRRGGWPGVTPITRRLLEYWTAPTASGASSSVRSRQSRRRSISPRS
jgi:type III restriction enzyme